MKPPKDPRDVLADRIQKWADTEDWHVYDYVDRLLADLDAAGWEVRRCREHDHSEEDDETATGATLLLSVYDPLASEDEDPDDKADSLIGLINDLRRRRGGGDRLIVGLLPSPQWVTSGAMKVLRRARELEREERDPNAPAASEGGPEQ